jgi:hypothetical protein
MHTKEPWAVNIGRVESKNEHGVANDGWIIAEFSGPEYRGNAKRVRDCVNALAGVPDPAAFMTAVGAVVAEWVKPNATIIPIALAKALGDLCQARGKH